MSKAKYWTARFADAGEAAIPEFVAETVGLATARKGSDRAAEGAVREQKQKLAAAGIDPADLDQWLAELEPAFFERSRKAALRLKGYVVVRKLGLAGRAPRKRQRPAGAR